MKIAVDKQPEPKKAKESTRIIFLLDRSTSMNSMREEAVAGYNQFLASQKKVKGKANVSLIFFDSAYEVVYEGMNVKEAPEIRCGSMSSHLTEKADDKYTYHPQGMTSLFDYVHSTIMRYKDTAKPGEKTIFAILTDGDDTSSRNHTYQTVQQAIKEAQDALKWEILFVGANMNASGFARSVGIKMSNVSQFDYTKKGIGDAIGTLSVASSYLRGDAGTMSSLRSKGVAAGASVNLADVYSAVAKGDVKDDVTDSDK